MIEEITIHIQTTTGFKPVQLIAATPLTVTVRDENGPLRVYWPHICWQDWPVCRQAITLAGLFSK